MGNYLPGLVLAGDTLAGFLDHVGVGSKARPGHHALPGGLEVSSVLVVEVTAETASAGLEHLRGRDLNTLAIEENPEGFLGEVDQVDRVFVPLDLHDNLLARAFLSNDLLDLSGTQSDFTGLAFNLKPELQTRGLGGHLEFGDTGQDLDFLLLTLDRLGQDSNGDLLSAVLEEQVVAVIQFVAVGLVIESPDVLGFNAARGRDLVPGHVLHNVVPVK